MSASGSRRKDKEIHEDDDKKEDTSFYINTEAKITFDTSKDKDKDKVLDDIYTKSGLLAHKESLQSLE